MSQAGQQLLSISPLRLRTWADDDYRRARLALYSATGRWARSAVAARVWRDRCADAASRARVTALRCRFEALWRSSRLDGASMRAVTSSLRRGWRRLLLAYRRTAALRARRAQIEQGVARERAIFERRLEAFELSMRLNALQAAVRVLAEYRLAEGLRQVVRAVENTWLRPRGDGARVRRGMRRLQQWLALNRSRLTKHTKLWTWVRFYAARTRRRRVATAWDSLHAWATQEAHFRTVCAESRYLAAACMGWRARQDLRSWRKLARWHRLRQHLHRRRLTIALAKWALSAAEAHRRGKLHQQRVRRMQRDAWVWKQVHRMSGVVHSHGGIVGGAEDNPGSAAAAADDEGCLEAPSYQHAHGTPSQMSHSRSPAAFSPQTGRCPASAVSRSSGITCTSCTPDEEIIMMRSKAMLRSCTSSVTSPASGPASPSSALLRKSTSLWPCDTARGSASANSHRSSLVRDTHLAAVPGVR